MLLHYCNILQCYWQDITFLLLNMFKLKNKNKNLNLININLDYFKNNMSTLHLKKLIDKRTFRIKWKKIN